MRTSWTSHCTVHGIGRNGGEGLRRLGSEDAEAYGERRCSAPRQEFRKKFRQHPFEGQLGGGYYRQQRQIEFGWHRLAGIGRRLAVLLTVPQAEIGIGGVKSRLAAVPLHLHGNIAPDLEWFVVGSRYGRARISRYRHLHEQQQRNDQLGDRATMNMHHGCCFYEMLKHPSKYLLIPAMGPPLCRAVPAPG